MKKISFLFSNQRNFFSHRNIRIDLLMILSIISAPHTVIQLIYTGITQFTFKFKTSLSGCSGPIAKKMRQKRVAFYLSAQISGSQLGAVFPLEDICQCTESFGASQVALAYQPMQEITDIGQIVRKIQRRKWQPTPIFLPGESHGQRSLVGYIPQGRKESDTTEVTWHATFLIVMMGSVVCHRHLKGRGQGCC